MTSIFNIRHGHKSSFTEIQMLMWIPDEQARGDGGKGKKTPGDAMMKKLHGRRQTQMLGNTLQICLRIIYLFIYFNPKHFKTASLVFRRRMLAWVQLNIMYDEG